MRIVIQQRDLSSDDLALLAARPLEISHASEEAAVERSLMIHEPARRSRWMPLCLSQIVRAAPQRYPAGAA